MITYNISHQNTMVLAFNEIEANFFAGFFCNFDVYFVDRRWIGSVYSKPCLRDNFNVKIILFKHIREICGCF